MSDISEVWTCPNCEATWIRSGTQSLVEWCARLVRTQLAHGQRCGR